VLDPLAGGAERAGTGVGGARVLPRPQPNAAARSKTYVFTAAAAAPTRTG